MVEGRVVVVVVVRDKKKKGGKGEKWMVIESVKK